MTPDTPDAPDAPGPMITLVALIDGVAQIRVASVVHRDQALLRISTLDPLTLAVGSVVGVSVAGRETTETSLALVSDSVGPAVTELRLIEARRARPG